MPLYDFRCQDCSELTPWVGPFSKRPEVIDCEKCGKQANRIFTVSRFQSNDAAARIEKQRFRTNEENWSGNAWHEFICDKCGVDDLICIEFKKGEDISPRQCESCDGTMRVKLSANIDRFSENFPYFDRGLGCWLKSKSHRKQIMKEKGLACIDGNVDFEAQADKQRYRDEENTKAWEKLNDRYENHPGFKDYRRARDKGIISA
jgi:putative FmdB family regulatory protein